MPLLLWEPLQTMAATFTAIQTGEDPWVALGNFSNEWFLYACDRREELVADAPASITATSLDASDERRWLTFIAASTEYLCAQYTVACPLWASHSRYRLATPWYDVVYLDQEIQTWLGETTPEPFRRRNIYCGNTVFLDKRMVVNTLADQPDTLEGTVFGLST